MVSPEHIDPEQPPPGDIDPERITELQARYATLSEEIDRLAAERDGVKDELERARGHDPADPDAS